MTPTTLFVLMRIAALTLAVTGYVVGIGYQYTYLVGTEGKGPGTYAFKMVFVFYFVPMLIMSIPGLLTLALPFATAQRSLPALLLLGVAIILILATSLFMLAQGSVRSPVIDGRTLGFAIAAAPITVVLILVFIARFLSHASWK